MNKWSVESKKIFLAVAALAAVPAFLAMRKGNPDWSDFWKVALPLLFVLAVYFFGCLILNHLRRMRMLRALPAIDYPFRSMTLLLVGYLVMALTILVWYFAFILWPQSLLTRLFSSLPWCLLVLASFILVVGGGGQLIRNKQGEGWLYRDQISPSRFSRQDFLFSLNGSWEEGMLLGFENFLYKGVESIEEGKKSLMLRGKNEDGEPYVLILYAPRSIKFVQEKLKDRSQNLSRTE